MIADSMNGPPPTPPEGIVWHQEDGSYDASEFYPEADAVLREIEGDPEALELALVGLEEVRSFDGTFSRWIATEVHDEGEDKESDLLVGDGDDE